MIKVRKIIYTSIAIITLLVFPALTLAQEVNGSKGTTECGIFSFLQNSILSGVLCSTPNTGTIGGTVATMVQSLITVIFIVVLIVAVLYTLKAAISYIRSEGNEQKVEGAKNAVKSVLLGVGAMFVALVGVVLIGSLFNGNNESGGLSKNIQQLIDCTLGLAKSDSQAKCPQSTL